MAGTKEVTVEAESSLEVMPYFVALKPGKDKDGYYQAVIAPPLDMDDADNCKSADPHQAVAHAFDVLSRWFAKQSKIGLNTP